MAADRLDLPDALNTMTRLISILLMAIALGAHSPFQAQHNSASLKASAEEILKLMVAEDFAAVADHVGDEFKGGLSAEWFGAIWGALITQTGPFKKCTSTVVGKGLGGYDEVILRCTFQKDQVTVKMLFDGDGEMVGLSIIPDTVVLTPPVLKPSEQQKEEAVKGLAGVVVRMIVDHYYPGVVSKFNAEMLKGLSENKLKEDWAAVVQNVGEFKQQVSARYDEEQRLHVVVVRCEFERGFMLIRVAFDDEGKIAGLNFLPDR